MFSDEKLVSAAAVTITAAVAAAITGSVAAFAARRAITLRASEGNRERAPVEFLAIPTIDRRLRFRLGSHFDESETARAARHAIADNAHGNDIAGLAKSLLKVVFRRAIGDAAHIELVPLH